MFSVYAVLVKGRVENWMNDVLAEMRITNRYITKKGIFDYGKEKERPRVEWIMANLGMVCLAANQVWWTAEVEEVFQKVGKGDKRAMKEYLKQQNKQIDELVLKGKHSKHLMRVWMDVITKTFFSVVFFQTNFR
jgi:dynein heavy chain, axonemal